MHRELQNACANLGLSLPHLAEAATNACEKREEARTWLSAEFEPDRCFDVIGFGSLAREELSEQSDFDFAVVAFGLPDDIDKGRKLLASVDRLRAEWMQKSPGSTGMFGRVLSAPDLTERIGLEQDTNQTHTLRILLLQESVSLYQPDLLRKLLQAILARYLRDYDNYAKPGVPRFLLNDLVRYWRTITVDYQAKRWRDRDSEWGLRYLKMRISRKLAFASTIASLFLNPARDRVVDVGYLLEQFSMPALARLAQLHVDLSEAGKAALGEALKIADLFCEALADKSFRDEAKLVMDLKSSSERFHEWRRQGDQLQKALQAVFFEDPFLARFSVNYLSF